MECCIVNLSTVRKYNRMDSVFFLTGGIARGQGLIMDVERAKEKVRTAIAKLRETKKLKAEADARFARMVANGEVTKL